MIERMVLIRNSVLHVSQQHEDDVLERMITEEDKFIARNNMKNLHIAPKTCVDLSRLSEMWRDRAQCHHRNDGLNFSRCEHACWKCANCVENWLHALTLRLVTCYFPVIPIDPEWRAPRSHGGALDHL